MLKVYGGLDDVVDVKWRAAIGAAGVMLDVLYFVELGVNSSPGGLVGHRCASTGDAVDDEDGVGHGIGRDQFDVGFLWEIVH